MNPAAPTFHAITKRLLAPIPPLDEIEDASFVQMGGYGGLLLLALPFALLACLATALCAGAARLRF